MATRVKDLIEALQKWEDPEAVVMYQYITSEHKQSFISETEFAQVAEFLEQDEEFSDALSDLMNEWISKARAIVRDLSPCCSAPLFHEACDECKSETEFVPVCEVCGQVDERQELRRCTKHEANAEICFGCNYLEKIKGETMLDDGTTAKLCGACFTRVEGGE